ncbi:copper resistance protein CopC [Dactylosporangium sp. NPDC051484]|uniref:copper resistance CopC family protein n=1 Tax=Dactylosporangium sp. NPDC051484 TaxID=3154942 RepID=UPI00344BDEA6
MRLPVRGLAVLAVVAALLLPASPAAAHGQLAMSDPVADSTVGQPRADLTLYFTETPVSYAWFTLTTPSGRRVEGAWRTGQPKRLDKPVEEYYLVDGKFEPRVFNTGYPAIIDVSHWPEQGVYTMAYQSVASDGEPVKGTLKFTYSGPVTQPPPGWTAPTSGPSAALAGAHSGATAAPSSTPGLFPDVGTDPGPAPRAAAQTPFVLTDWLIPGAIIAGVAFMIVAAARRAPVAAPKKKRRQVPVRG